MFEPTRGKFAILRPVRAQHQIGTRTAGIVSKRRPKCIAAKPGQIARPCLLPMQHRLRRRDKILRPMRDYTRLKEYEIWDFKFQIPDSRFQMSDLRVHISRLTREVFGFQNELCVLCFVPNSAMRTWRTSFDMSISVSSRVSTIKCV